MSVLASLPPLTTTVIWLHVGKEHGRGHAESIRRNDPDVVDSYIRKKLDAAAERGHNAFWDEGVLVEVNDGPDGARSLIAYDGAAGLQLSRGKKGPRWLVDVIALESLTPEIFVARDLLIDVAVGDRLSQFEVLDLDEFARALELGVLDLRVAVAALRSLHCAVEALAAGVLPVPSAARLWASFCR